MCDFNPPKLTPAQRAEWLRNIAAQQETRKRFSFRDLFSLPTTRSAIR